MIVERKNEGGFTLVELLITVTIEAFVLTALASALIVTFKGTSSVNQSFVRTSDARIAAHYVLSDARNSSGPETSLGASTCTDVTPAGTVHDCRAPVEVNVTKPGAACTR